MEHVNQGKHLFNHATSLAERFLEFLQKNEWPKGLLIELECHRGHSIDYFRREHIFCFGIHTDSEWNKRAKQLYPRSEYRLGPICDPEIKNGLASAVFAINPRPCPDELAIAEAWRILKPGGYLCMHFYLENKGPDEQLAIRPLLSKFEILNEMKFSSLRFHPQLDYNFIYEVMCRKS